MIRRLTSYNLGIKLFLSHLLVALFATLTFVGAAFGLSFLGVWDGNDMLGIFGAPGEVMEFTGGVFGTTFLYLLLASGPAAIVAFAASLFVAGRITTPLRNMLTATRRISTGSYTERVPVVEEDEIGDLSEEFNSMAAALERGERQRQEFIADVSHELGTPLSTLQGYMEGLMDGVVEPSEETWGLLYSETERMRRLVNDLRQLSRVESGQLELRIGPTPTAETVRVATETMQPLFAEKSVELTSYVPDSPPDVAADPDRLTQVLTNLLTNALRHTPPGGGVSVECSVERSVERSTLTDRVSFRIADTGDGIPASDLPHLFERFYRVEKSRSRESGGSGLGLAISRGLVVAMNGSIWAESGGSDEGAVFVMELPIATEGPARPPEMQS